MVNGLLTVYPLAHGELRSQNVMKSNNPENMSGGCIAQHNKTRGFLDEMMLHFADNLTRRAGDRRVNSQRSMLAQGDLYFPPSDDTLESSTLDDREIPVGV